MKILYIHQYFRTPYQSGGTRSYWIAQELIKNGHDVTMLTSSSEIDKRSENASIDGINVIYLKVPYNNYMSVSRRLFSFLSFMFKSTIIGLRQKDLNLVIATSTPLTVGFPALVIKLFKKTPFLFEVRDLWPEVPIQMGAFKNKMLINMSRRFEKTIYKNALHIVALSPGMQEGVIDTGIPKKKVSIIPNMSKIDEFWSREKDVELNNNLGIPSTSFKVIYFGAMGIANGMDYILDAAKLITEEKQIDFFILGDGSTKPGLEARCKEENIDNVQFLGKFPMTKLSEIVNLCDVSLVTFKNLPILATNSPNKLFDSLSAGKPIIVNSDGWTKDLVEENNCGVFVDPLSPKELADAIIKLKNNPALCKEMGKNSRILAETVYDKSILCENYVNIVDSLKIS